jgi:hypothetical protein
MPKGWFFEIHEDTPEQEAANLMEHSASVLDISSDDDAATKQQNEERGKENIPPPDFLLSQPRVHSSSEAEVEVEVQVDEPVKKPRLRTLVQDAMDEDRRPLGDLVPAEFYGEGCDASSYVTVDVGIEKPSGLSKEFDFSSAEESVEEDVVVAPGEEEIVAVAEAGAVVASITEEVVDIAPVAEATVVDVPAAADVADDVAL